MVHKNPQTPDTSPTSATELAAEIAAARYPSQVRQVTGVRIARLLGHGHLTPDQSDDLFAAKRERIGALTHTAVEPPEAQPEDAPQTGFDPMARDEHGRRPADWMELQLPVGDRDEHIDYGDQ